MSQTQKILVIDDSQESRYILVKQIGKIFSEKYELMEASTFKDAIKIIKREKLDLIISDYYLDDFLGTDISDYCLSNNYNIPFIFITVSLSDNLFDKVIKSGAYHFLEKGNYNQESLRNCILYAIEHHKYLELKKSTDDIILVKELAAGIAHKFSQPIQIISGQLDMLMINQQGKNLDDMKEALDRIVALVDDLRNLTIINRVDYGEKDQIIDFSDSSESKDSEN
jgi:CheY-like chemotaxis protein